MAEDRLAELVQEFLAKKRVAIWGIEDGKGDPGQWLAKRLRKRGTEVIEVNPAFGAGAGEGRASSLTEVDPPVEAVLLYVDRPQAMEAAEDAVAAKVPLVWLHDAMSPGAGTPEAVARLTEAGATVIPALCPMLYMKPVDPAHFCLKWVLKLTGKERRTREQVAQRGEEPR